MTWKKKGNFLKMVSQHIDFYTGVGEGGRGGGVTQLITDIMWVDQI